jgi:Fe-S-cluster-containing dehydrogenase component
MLPAATIAWQYVLAGAPEDSPNYTKTDHWWGMLIDIPKCVGCGNCVRACQAENDVPDGYFRTWVGRYLVTDWDLTNPEGISPDGGKEGFSVAKEEDNGKYFFVPKMCNHCADSPCTQVCPVGATFITPDGVVLVDQTYCLGCAYCVLACTYGCPIFTPTRRSQIRHAVLPPDYQGHDDGVLRELPDRRAPTRRPERSEGSHSCLPEDLRCSGAQAADGHGSEGFLQRFGWFGAVEL